MISELALIFVQDIYKICTRVPNKMFVKYKQEEEKDMLVRGSFVDVSG